MTNKERRAQEAQAKLLANAEAMGIPTLGNAPAPVRPKWNAVGNTLLLKGPTVAKEAAGGLLKLTDTVAQNLAAEAVDKPGYLVLQVGPLVDPALGIKAGDRVVTKQLAEVVSKNNITGEAKTRVLEHVTGKWSEMYPMTEDWIMFCDASLVIGVYTPEQVLDS